MLRYEIKLSHPTPSSSSSPFGQTVQGITAFEESGKTLSHILAANANWYAGCV